MTIDDADGARRQPQRGIERADDHIQLEYMSTDQYRDEERKRGYESPGEPPGVQQSDRSSGGGTSNGVTEPEDGRTDVVLLNHTDMFRPEVDKLTRALPMDEFDVTVVLPEACRPTLERQEAVDYRFYDAAFLPNIRYNIPKPSFLGVLMDALPGADVVHVIGYSYLPSALAVAVASRFDAHTVVTVDAMRGVSWSYGNRFVDAVAFAYTRLLGGRVFERADHVVGLGDYLLSDFDRFVDDPSKVEIIPNGVDVDRFSPPESGGEELGPTNESPIRLLYVGRLDTVKGVPYLLEAVEALKRRDQKEYRLTIVGDGSRRAAYERLCTSAGIDGEVSFEGYQSDVSRYYARSDIFVLPSISEGLPTVIMEAQACGLPVVSTDVGGAWELVRGGRIVPKKDASSLSEAIAGLADTDLVERGAEARRHVVQNYSLEQMSAEYSELYRRIVDGDRE